MVVDALFDLLHGTRLIRVSVKVRKWYSTSMSDNLQDNFNNRKKISNFSLNTLLVSSMFFGYIFRKKSQKTSMILREGLHGVMSI